MNIFYNDAVIRIEYDSTVRDIYQKVAINLDKFFYLSRLTSNGDTLDDLDAYVSDTDIADGDRLGLIIRRTESNYHDYQTVKINGLYLANVEDQTEEIVFEAIKENTEAFFDVIDKTDEVCLLTLERSPYMIGHMDNPGEKDFLA